MILLSTFYLGSRNITCLCLVHAGLYYDSNKGIWYSYDHQTQQYVPADQNNNKASEKQAEPSRVLDNTTRKVVISAPASTVAPDEKASLPDAVQAAATAALAAEKKEKEKLKEIKLASKSSILANKKKMNNVLTMWKQRSHEGQTARVALDNGEADESTIVSKSKVKAEAVVVDTEIKPIPVSNSSRGALMGVIRGSGRGVVKSDTSYLGSSASFGVSTSSLSSSSSVDVHASVVTPYKTDASALGSYPSHVSAGTGKRRFSEMPHQQNSTTGYRDRAAERRSLYGSSSKGDDSSDLMIGDTSKLA